MSADRLKGFVSSIGSRKIAVCVSKVAHPHHPLGGDVIEVDQIALRVASKLKKYESVTFYISEGSGYPRACDVQLENPKL